MADIHVLEGRLKGYLDEAILINFQVAFHIPITDPKPEVTFPDIVSAVPDISTEELDALKAGTLFEIVKTVIYNSNVSTANQSQRLKDMWAKIKGEMDEVYPWKYKFFGVTLDVD